MKQLLVQLLISLLFALPVVALERFDIITTEELQSMLVEKEAGKIDFLLINTLDKLIADHHSIPGSINIPWSQVESRIEELGEDKEKLIITYCMGYR